MSDLTVIADRSFSFVNQNEVKHLLTKQIFSYLQRCFKTYNLMTQIQWLIIRFKVFPQIQ